MLGEVSLHVSIVVVVVVVVCPPQFRKFSLFSLKVYSYSMTVVFVYC